MIACNVMLFVAILVFSKQTHFIWSRTELLGRCDIAVGTVCVSAGTGVGTRSSRDPSVRMVGLVGSHTHLTHLALKLRKREDVDETEKQSITKTSWLCAANYTSHQLQRQLGFLHNDVGVKKI